MHSYSPYLYYIIIILNRLYNSNLLWFIVRWSYLHGRLLTQAMIKSNLNIFKWHRVIVLSHSNLQTPPGVVTLFNRLTPQH